MTDGVEMGVLPGMGDIPASSVPAADVVPSEDRAARRKRAAKKGRREPAEILPVARVAVDMSLPHLDRPFDYLVPTTLDAVAVPGCRVRVRFAGQLVDGFLLERVEQSDHEGRLAYLERVTSPEPVLTPEIAALAREIADRYAGTLADVLRLAIPPRHARVEAENTNPSAPETGGAAETPDEPPGDPGPHPTAPAGEPQAPESVATGDGSQPEPSEKAGPPADADQATSGTPLEAPPRLVVRATPPPAGPGERPAPGTGAVGETNAAKASTGAGEAPAGETGELGENEVAGPGGAASGASADASRGETLANREQPPTGGPETSGEPEQAGPGGGASGDFADVSPGEVAAGGPELSAGKVSGEENVATPGQVTAVGPAAAPSTPGSGTEATAGEVPEATVTDPSRVGAGGSGAGPSGPARGAADGAPEAAVAGSGGVGSERAAAASSGFASGVTAGEGAVAGPGRVGAAGASYPAREAAGDAGEAVAGSGVEASGLAQGAAAGRVETTPGVVAGTSAEAGRVGEKGVEPGPWAAYPAGPSFLSALAARRAPRAVWSALPGGEWAPSIARAARAVLAGNRGALIVVADGRDVARVDDALTQELGAGRHVALTAELGPAERYRRWLAVRRGHVSVVVGTRAAIFAPVRDLGLVVLWDDGDDVHAEPHAPYPHAREVLALRAHRAGAGALIGGFTRTTDATQLVETGWARPLVPERDTLRRSMAYIRPSGDDEELARDEAARSARLPQLAFRTARQGLEHGPVLVQVPRRGYVPALACSRCRGPARCQECEGPLSLRSSHAAPYCLWCGRIAGAWTCPECGGRQVRAVVVGARRTAEELGRAFPGVPIRTSGRDGVLDKVTGEPALVVATPGAEPVAENGYAAALLLDGWVLLGRADLRAGEEALRRWMNAAALVRPRGTVVVLADGSLIPVQALIRWDAVTFAERELAERRELGFPPAVRMASLTGTPQSVRELVEAADLPEDAEVLGPVDVGEGQERALVRMERARGTTLSRLLKTAQAARSTRRTTDVVRVRVDPLELI